MTRETEPTPADLVMLGVDGDRVNLLVWTQRGPMGVRLSADEAAVVRDRLSRAVRRARKGAGE